MVRGGHGSAQRDLRGTGGPDPAGDPGPAGRRGRDRHGAGRAVRDQPAGDLPTSEGAGAGRADRPQPQCPMAVERPAGATAAGGHAVDGAVPTALGREPRAARRPPETTTTTTGRRAVMTELVIT